jgi:hypothetical protein
VFNFGDVVHSQKYHSAKETDFFFTLKAAVYITATPHTSLYNYRATKNTSLSHTKKDALERKKNHHQEIHHTR